jgi:Putative prokaryotic signal transducing protein
MSEWVTVYKEKIRARAELLKNELESKGIDVVILDKVDHIYPVLGMVELRVLSNKKMEAVELINEFRFDD